MPTETATKTQVQTPFCSAKVGSDSFVWGDSKLLSVTLTRAEGSTASNCSFSIYDKGRKFTDKYFTTIYREGGLTPIVPPSQPSNFSTGGFSGGASNIGAGSYGGTQLSPTQVGNANTIVTVGRTVGASDRDITIALMTSLQESTLVNLPGGDGDSSGLFQQTPGNSWGSRAEVRNAEYASRAFFTGAGTNRGLLDIPNRGSLSLGAAAQAVQGSAFPDAYDKWQATAAALLAAAGSTPTTAGVEESQEKAATPVQEKLATVTAPTGQQITIELGYDGKVICADSFIHTSIDFDALTNVLTFGGQAVSWVMSQKKRSTAFTNSTFKGIVTQVAGNYGITADVPDTVDTAYEYLPQRGISDFEMILSEARRLGLRVTTKGKTLSVKPREPKDIGFVLEYGVNLRTFTVSHKAQTDSTGGARASASGSASSTGQTKFDIDPDTGELQQTRAETAKDTSTTGTVKALPTPVVTPMSKADTAAANRRESEMRLQGFIANFTAIGTPDLLVVTPDSIFSTKGITDFLDRVWVISSITHTLDKSGLQTSGSCYTPLKAKYVAPVAIGSTGAAAGGIPGSINEAIYNAAIAHRGTSSRNDPYTQGGTLACVSQVNKVLEAAGVPNPWQNSLAVANAEAALSNPAVATRIPVGSEQRGDIIIQNDTGHIGVVIGSGRALSNSSSRAAFVWESGLEMGSSGPPRIYRLK
jgi:phage protein D